MENDIITYFRDKPTLTLEELVQVAGKEKMKEIIYHPDIRVSVEIKPHKILFNYLNPKLLSSAQRKLLENLSKGSDLNYLNNHALVQFAKTEKGSVEDLQPITEIDELKEFLE